MAIGAAHRTADRNALMFLSLVSGLGGVVYEVLYMRQLTAVLGDMFYVHAALLSMFLFGNGIGAWLARRFRRYLFAFELAIGLYALSLPALIPIYEASFLGRLLPDPVLQSLLAAAMLLAVPSVCIGFSIPLFSEYIRAQGQGRDAFKIAYLLYNVGAAISVLAVEFYLLRWLGITASLYWIGSANLSCGVLLLARRGVWGPGAATPGAGDEAFSPRTCAAMFLASVGAALFMGYYIKVCYHLFLPHRENFAICTAIGLFAISLGTVLAKTRRWSFATALSLAMVSLVVVYASFEWVAVGFRYAGEIAPLWTRTGREVGFGFVLAVPYVFLGATIPALLQHEGDVARRSGTLLLLSGLGNVAGMLAYIFIVHPRFSVFAAPLAVWGVLTAALLLHDGRRRARQFVFIGVSALLLPVVYGHPEEAIYLVHDRTPPDASIVNFKSTADNVTYVTSAKRDYIVYNGHPSIEVTSDGVVNRAEILCGIIPALTAPHRGRALVLGLGTGITGGTAARLFEHTDVAEINSAFFQLLDRIDYANFRITTNPAATIIHDDARRHLVTTDRRYDVVINSVPSPTYFAAGKIYTLEFFDRVKRALVPGGVYCSWLSPLDLSNDGLQTLLATLHERFEFCNLAVLRSGYYFTTCSDDPVETRNIADIDLPPELRSALRGLRGVDLEHYFRTIFISRNIFGPAGFSGVPLNTDDFPIIEFQIMARDRLQRDPMRVADPVVAESRRFNLEVPTVGDDERFLDEAVVFAQVHAPLFTRYYRPILDRDPDLRARFNTRIEAGGE